MKLSLTFIQQQGLELLDKACTGNNAFSCYYISGIFIQGVKDVIAKDMSKAFDYSNKACDLGNMYACANVSQVRHSFVFRLVCPIIRGKFFSNVRQR